MEMKKGKEKGNITICDKYVHLFMFNRVFIYIMLKTTKANAQLSYY